MNKEERRVAKRVLQRQLRAEYQAKQKKDRERKREEQQERWRKEREAAEETRLERQRQRWAEERRQALTLRLRREQLEYERECLLAAAEGLALEEYRELQGARGQLLQLLSNFYGRGRQLEEMRRHAEVECGSPRVVGMGRGWLALALLLATGASRQ